MARAFDGAYRDRMVLRGLCLPLVLFAACSGPAPDPDRRFLAARAETAALLAGLFDENSHFIAPHPEAEGEPVRSPVGPSTPDPRQFAVVAEPALPAPGARLAACHQATASALSSFAQLTGSPMGEGIMAAPRLDTDGLYAEGARQAAALVAAYCHWRDATRVCRTAATAAGLPAPADFDPPNLPCPVAGGPSR